MLTGQELVAAARSMLGVRFQHQGRDAVHGVDCLGMLLVVAQRVGVQFDGADPLAWHLPNYRTKPDTQMLQQQLQYWLVTIEFAAMQHGDVLLLSIDGAPQHLALLSDYPAPGEFAMIHAHAAARKVVEHRYDAVWQRATHAVFRLPGVV